MLKLEGTAKLNVDLDKVFSSLNKEVEQHEEKLITPVTFYYDDLEVICTDCGVGMSATYVNIEEDKESNKYVSTCYECPECHKLVDTRIQIR